MNKYYFIIKWRSGWHSNYEELIGVIAENLDQAIDISKKIRRERVNSGEIYYGANQEIVEVKVRKLKEDDFDRVSKVEDLKEYGFNTALGLFGGISWFFILVYFLAEAISK